jgi:hypothetical protein
MSATKETFSVSRSSHGWIVKAHSRQGHFGPYADREHAITRALIFARENRPTRVRIKNAPGEWRAECTYNEAALPPG